MDREKKDQELLERLKNVEIESRKRYEIEHETYLKEHEEYKRKMAEIKEELAWWDSVKDLPREERVRAICAHIDQKRENDKDYQERLREARRGGLRIASALIEERNQRNAERAKERALEALFNFFPWGEA